MRYLEVRWKYHFKFGKYFRAKCLFYIEIHRSNKKIHFIKVLFMDIKMHVSLMLAKVEIQMWRFMQLRER